MYLNKNLRMPSCVTSNRIKIFLILLLLMLVYITVARYWTQDVFEQLAIPRTLSPGPWTQDLSEEQAFLHTLSPGPWTTDVSEQQAIPPTLSPGPWTQDVSAEQAFLHTLSPGPWTQDVSEEQAFLHTLSPGPWSQDVPKQQALPHTLSPGPRIEILKYESSLCLSTNTPIKPPPNYNIRCPQKPIVTVQQLGRLGNQIFEYISVWAAAKKTGREPYVPSCMIRELEKIFRNLPIPPLSYLANCTVEELPVPVTVDTLEYSNGSIILPRWVQLPTYIAPLVGEIRQMFQFKEHIISESQRLLHSAANSMKNITYVGVHVRRTDYIAYLKRKYNVPVAKPDYFLRQMNVFRNKYQRVLFVVVSDDPKWCERELHGDDVVVIKTNSPTQDLAIMSACNHSIIDYGTYGMWGALMSGGDTFVYNLTQGGAYALASVLPNWYVGT